MGILHLPMISLIILILSYNLSFHALSIAAGNIITPNQSLADGQTLISPNRAFALGFFTPNNSTHRYLGVWYNNIPIQTVVWVANRQTPIVSGSGVVLSLSPEGNLVLGSRTGSIPWSTNTFLMSNPVVELLNSGNLVLTEGVYDQSNSSSIVWQSFDYPSDTLLPGMKLGWDLRANREMRLTSWQSASDPSLGPYTYGVDQRGVPELYIWNKSVPESRSGYSNGYLWRPFDPINDSLFSMLLMTTNNEVYYTFEILIASVTSQIVLDQFGSENILVWQSQNWTHYSHRTADQCDVYDQCGVFGLCSIENFPICRCLRGFEPRSPVAWMLQDFRGGCVRRTSLNCTDRDGFLVVSGVKLPATNEAGITSKLNFDLCRGLCMINCSCSAFALINSGCISWFGDLVDMRGLIDGGDDLYVRLAVSDLEVKKRRWEPIVVIVAVSLAVFILCSLMLLTWIKCKYKWTKASTEKTNLPFGNGKEINFRENERDLVSPIYSLSSIIQATDNFSYVNKLGEGGFGPVYKGQLTEGQEIAVKRLAARSGQGLKEFENEIILIAKLQHRNLVRLMGYCIHGEEKILIYEYMPNKSLDYFLFDTNRRAQLDWGRRLHIIEGISQGLLYLHKHSRLRIIHRDLKASNILLDADMNPKISDFGMARIFGSNETEANTNRIVGTYGYMSPEYAAGGVFSVKSDVFSFGVLLLEIVSGSKNTIYYQQDNTLNLLGYAWELWTEAKWLELVDPSFDENCPKHEISRCIHVALMCVQENAIDRPNMSDVIAMLSSDSAILDPKQPAFFNVRNPAEEVCSVNEVTITAINGR